MEAQLSFDKTLVFKLSIDEVDLIVEALEALHDDGQLQSNVQLRMHISGLSNVFKVVRDAKVRSLNYGGKNV